MNTLTFYILDEDRRVYGPVHISLDVVTEESLKSAVEKIRQPFMKYINRKIEYENRPVEKEEKERDYLIYKFNPNYKPYRYCEPEKDELVDPTRYFFEQDFYVDEIVLSILEKGYYKLYNYQKYYNIVFEICHN